MKTEKLLLKLKRLEKRLAKKDQQRKKDLKWFKNQIKKIWRKSHEDARKYSNRTRR